MGMAGDFPRGPFQSGKKAHAEKRSFPSLLAIATQRPSLHAAERWLGHHVVKIGQCCICGANGVRLSFEHIPPRAAFNDQRIFETNIQDMMKGQWEGQSRPVQGQWVQGGAGKHTLCEKCNNDTEREAARLLPRRKLREALQMLTHNALFCR
jgi:hypothetical protein